MRGGGENKIGKKPWEGMGQADHMLLNEHLSKCHYNLKNLNALSDQL